MHIQDVPSITCMHVAMKPEEDIEFLWKWRKYLLLLATLVASVTYVAGLNPPGGVRSEDGGNGPEQHVRAVHPPASPSPAPAVYPFRVGDPVLVSTYSRRYTAFFYCNAAAFVASLVIIMFLLDRRLSGNRVGLTVLRLAMLLDLLALMAAFAAGSCRDVVASIYVSALFAVVFAYVALHLRVASVSSSSRLLLFPCGESTCLVLLRRNAPAVGAEEEKRLKERRKFLLLLATFATPLTYGAGLAPPGGFWSGNGAEHRAGAPLLHDGPYKIRYHAFFYANATSFVASLAIIMLLMSRTLRDRLARSYALLVCVLVELLGLMAAYAAGSCRWITTTVYIACLVGAVFLYIVLVPVFALDMFKGWREFIGKILRNTEKDASRRIMVENVQEDKVEQSRSLVLLLATLAATVTYQAGLSPPGGVWPQGHLKHTAGNPVLHDTHPKRYMAFYHCNTAAFVASVVVIIIVQSKELSAVGRAALKTAMILDLLGLMGAYVAGSCRDVSTTIYVAALALAVFVYSIAKVLSYRAHGQTRLMTWVLHMAKKFAKKLLGRFFSEDQPKSDGDDDAHLERKRKFLLQLAILAAAVTYQTGLNPPGGFFTESNGGRAGDPILLDHYGVRYQVFFYCNATGFMASVTVILLLVNQTLSKQGIRSNALHVCVMVGLLGLMGAYAAGSCRKLRTSIYVFALVAAVVAFLILQILLYVFAHCDRWSHQLPCLPQRLFETLSTGPAGAKNKIKEVSAEETERYLKRKYLMVLGILAASVTYQAGLAPPGGTWGDDDTALSPLPPPSAPPPTIPGNPILLYLNTARYQAFFYCNATSFVASVVVILLLLQPTLKPDGASLRAMQTAVVLDLLGLLGAYAAGSCRDWETSAYVIALVVAVVVFITIYVLLSLKAKEKATELKVWRYFSDKKAKVLKYLGGSNDHHELPAATAPATTS